MFHYLVSDESLKLTGFDQVIAKGLGNALNGIFMFHLTKLVVCPFR